MGKGESSGKRNIRRDMFALFLLGFTVFLAISLISYNKNDSTWFFASSEQANEEGYKNLTGIFGAECSGLMFEIFGYASLFIPLFLFVFSFSLIRQKTIEKKILRTLGLITFFLSICTILQFPFRGESVSSISNGIMPGGMIGSFFTGIAESLLGAAGSYILLAIILFVSLFLLTEFSIIKGTISTAQGAGKAASWMRIKMRAVMDSYYSWRHRKKHSAEIKPKIEIEKLKPEPVIEQIEEIEEEEIIPEPVQQAFKFMDDYTLPTLDLLRDQSKSESKMTKQDILLNSRILEKKLRDFGIEGKVTEVRPGPVITMYEFEPAPGVKINKIVSLADDLSLAMKAINVRIVAPLPGKGTVGIEIPNTQRESVYLKEILQSESFMEHPSKLCIAMGKDFLGNPFLADLAKMPHLLIAGTTGSGKSVAVNMMILSLLYRTTPEEVKMIMVDPKMLELSIYQEIPHLLIPVVTNPKEASYALQWAVREMSRRYELMKDKGVRNITAYNKFLEENAIQESPLPYIVIFIDELADLMMVASKSVEDSIQRLSQMARAAGIHLIIATQRPSVDVITGVIKANFSWRVALQVSTKIDSRTILDVNGAEQLLGKGDMLLMSPGYNKLTRVHGAFVSDSEVTSIVEFIKKQRKSIPDLSVITPDIEEGEEEGAEEDDEKYEEVLRWIVKTKQVSISMVQRKFRVGYNRAARMIEKMEASGIVGAQDGIKPREVLMDEMGLDDMLMRKRKPAVPTQKRAPKPSTPDMLSFSYPDEEE
ncbi:MAG: DNA translocase FtsK [Candidatus Schekmanbacteria bacterium]|nr:DNA translocase FtsK [Candidatus Schekmanbacteria bacterium]